MVAQTKNKNDVLHGNGEKNPAVKTTKNNTSTDAKEQARTKMKKEKFLENFARLLGSIGNTCQSVGIHRDVYYQWMRKDAAFARKVREISSKEGEYGEDILKELVVKRNVPSVHLFVKSVNPKYRPKSRVEITPPSGQHDLADVLAGTGSIEQQHGTRSKKHK